MLVLSRKVGARILVGADVVITVVRIGPNAVRLGIEAPKGVNIAREELRESEELTHKGLNDECDPHGRNTNIHAAEAATGLASERRIQASDSDVEDLGRRAVLGPVHGSGD